MTKERDPRVRDCVCPNPDCGKRIDGYMGVSQDTFPSPGDATVCLYCQMICIYEGEPDHLLLRRASDDEIDEVLRVTGDDLLKALRVSSHFRGYMERKKSAN